ncbi:hypothetical protein QBC38DRAFT_345159, partial [Podospora fimiseda]
MADEGEVPPKFDGKGPVVSPGVSGGKVVEGDFPLDQVVTCIDKFPLGYIVRSCHRYGSSEWTVSARIEATLANGDDKSFFPRQSHARGRIDSMNELYKVSPDFVPKPWAGGSLSVPNPPTYYFLCVSFNIKADQEPDPVRLCEKLVTLHKKRVSPTGKFGFHLRPLRGNVPLNTTWNPSWVDLFSRFFRYTIDLEEIIN